MFCPAQCSAWWRQSTSKSSSGLKSSYLNTDENPDVRASALRALGKLHPEPASLIEEPQTLPCSLTEEEFSEHTMGPMGITSEAPLGYLPNLQSQHAKMPQATRGSCGNSPSVGIVRIELQMTAFLLHESLIPTLFWEPESISTFAHTPKQLLILIKISK